MSTFGIYFGANTDSENYNVPFYVEIIQNSVVVLSAFSTEGNKTTKFIKSTTSFDATQTTTIRYYNLGKKSNYVGITLINTDNSTLLLGNDVIALSGQKAERTINIPAGSFTGYLNILCYEQYQTLTGVDYVGDGTQTAGLYPNVISTKAGDSSFVGVTTPNNSLNPNYIPPTSLSKPTVSQTTILDSQSLTVSGMQIGDLLHFILNGVDQFPDGQSISSTGQLIIPMSGWGGLTAFFYYIRSSVTSPNSDTVNIVNDASVLDPLTIQTDLTRPNIYVGEWVDVTDFQSGASLAIGVTNSNFTGVEGIDFTKTTITGGFRIVVLKAQIYNFWQTKAGYVDSSKRGISVGQTRPSLAKPSSSAYSLLINQTVTVTNQSSEGYTNINLYRNGILIIPSDGYHTVDLGVYTFLQVGDYQFVGQKTDIVDSEFSDIIKVQATVNIPTLLIDKFENSGGTYNVVSGETAILSVTGIFPSAGDLIYYEKNLTTNTLSPRLTISILDIYTTNAITNANLGYVAKFRDDYGNLGNESNVIRFNFVTQSKTSTPSVIKIGDNAIKAVFGSDGTNKDFELWGIVSPSTVYAKIGGTLSTSGTEYTFSNLPNGSYKVRATQSDLTVSDFSSEIVILLAGDIQRFTFVDESSLNLYTIGNVLDQNSSGAGYRWIMQNENFPIEAVIAQQDNVDANGVSGVAIFEISSFDLVSVDTRFVALLAKNNGTIGVSQRTLVGSVPVLVKTQSVAIPVRLKIEKAGNDALFYYSTDTTSTSVIYTLFHRINGVFTDYTGFAIALVASSGTEGIQETRFKNIVGDNIKVGQTGSA